MYVTTLSNIIKQSRATSRGRWLNGEKSSVSRAICVLVPRELVTSDDVAGSPTGFIALSRPESFTSHEAVRSRQRRVYSVYFTSSGNEFTV
jgi:hypothetical protein